MPKISAVIITYNEERNIERCLQSLQGVADEIVVVDSFSTDRTREICNKYQVKFVCHKFDGHIEQKNWAITQAAFPHVLSLDADEALDEELKKSIKGVKENWKFEGYTMNRLTNYCGKWIRYCGWYPDRKLRLWDSRKGEWQGINPHDEYKMKGAIPVGHLKGDILHYSYYEVSEHYKQSEYFSDIAAKAYLKKGKKSNWIKIIMSPAIKFIKTYFIKLGFLDGREGFLISKISAYATYIKYLKLYRLQKNG